MINHVRTLLLNRTSVIAGPDSGLPYAELIDPDFRPVTLSADLATVRAAFLPAGASVESELVELAYLAHVLHAADLEPYVLAFDSRISYARGETTDAPTRTLVDSLAVLQNLDLSGRLLPVVFAPWDAAPDLTVLRQTWQMNSEVILRAGVVLLGLAWQCERLRRGVPRQVAGTTLRRIS